ncbi:MAG: tetratricopeptide repeat protein [Vicinamibacteria bacterium]|nr:tetratricopeptide repeat protein [Vicinamibacteria bacterium]
MRFHGRCLHVFVWAFVVVAAFSGAEDAPDCAAVFRTERSKIESALEQGFLDDAVKRAKALFTRCPDEPAAACMLARAHVAEEDLVAAASTLRERLRRNPDDCAMRAWLAWVLIKQGAFDRARTTLGESTACPANETERRRWLLFGALLARQENDHHTARRLLAQVGERAALLPEDRELSRELNISTRAGWSPPFRFVAELSGGGTSDAHAASPTDRPGSGASSVLARSRLDVRLRAPESAGIAPFIETSVRGHGIAADGARELSYVDLGLRAGVELCPGGVTSRLAYRHEELWLNLDGGSRFSMADRVELDASIARFDLNVGFGRRDFHDRDRSRDEIDAAAVRSIRIRNRPVLLAIGARSYRARRAAYHQIGVTLTGALLDLDIGRSCTAEVTAVTAFDVYPSSGGADGRLVFGTDCKRRDLSGRLSLSFWRRLTKHARIGARYDYARRWSTADQQFRHYPFTEHRGMIELRIFSAGNPWRRSVEAGSDHVPIPYATSASPEDADRIQETLRPDDDLASGCGDVCDVP